MLDVATPPYSVGRFISISRKLDFRFDYRAVYGVFGHFMTLGSYSFVGLLHINACQIYSVQCIFKIGSVLPFIFRVICGLCVIN